MDAWKLPTSLCVGGTDYKIRTDFRVVLDILEAMNDPDLFLPDASEEEIALVRSDTMVQILYEDYQTIPPESFAEACEKALDFIDMGMKDDGKKKPHSMDWQQDAQIIIPAINRVQGCEIRALPYLHWWTFLGGLYGDWRLPVFPDSQYPAEEGKTQEAGKVGKGIFECK